MKYKEGDKFVIEIDNVITSDNGTLYKIKGFNSLVFDAFGLNKLSQVIDSVAEDKHYKGAEDAWELAKLITIYTYNGGLNSRDLNEIFGTASRDDIFRSNTYKEAQAKFDAWEKAKEEIKIGDEVCLSHANGIVVYIYQHSCDVMWSDGSCGNFDISRLTKTGRNFADKVGNLFDILRN